MFIVECNDCDWEGKYNFYPTLVKRCPECGSTDLDVNFKRGQICD